MGIDLESLSITSAYNSIVAFFRSQENNSSWTDLTTGSEGIFLIRMLSNILTNISYKTVTARRENYLTTANLLSSVIGIAVNLGYSAFRGRNQRRTIRVKYENDLDDSLVLPKFSVIGELDEDFDIILLDELSISSGEYKNIEVIIGKKDSLEFVTGTSNIKLFTQFVSDISEDYILTVDGDDNIVPTTVNMKDMIHDKYLVRTNPYLSVDIMYLNNIENPYNKSSEDANERYKYQNTGGKYRYGDDSTIKLTYITLAEAPSTEITEDMLSDLTYVKTLSITPHQVFQTVDEVKQIAPIDHEVQNLIRSKEDYSKRFRQEIPNVTSSSYVPVTPTYTLISYMKNDYTLATINEISNLYTQILEDENYFGTPLPDIDAPRRFLTPLNIKISLSNKYKTKSEIRSDIDNILKTNYSVDLNQTFNTFDLERLIENSLSYVKYARVSYDIVNWSASTRYQVGTLLNKDGNTYMVDYVGGISGVEEPDWDIPLTVSYLRNIDLVQDNNYTIKSSEVSGNSYLENLGFNEVSDGELVWRTYKRLDVESVTTWSSLTNYRIGDYVLPTDEDLAKKYMFKCVDLRKQSGTDSPDVSSMQEKDFLVDGNIIWVCKATADYTEREKETNYRMGESVNIDGKSFECIGYAGTSGSIEPDLSHYRYAIEDTVDTIVQGVTRHIGYKVVNNVSGYFVVGDTVKVSNDASSLNYTIKSVSYKPDVIYGGTFIPSTGVATLTSDAKEKLGVTSDTITLYDGGSGVSGYVFNEGIYYIASTSGTFGSIQFLENQKLFSDGTQWKKYDVDEDIPNQNDGHTEIIMNSNNVSTLMDYIYPYNRGKYDNGVHWTSVGEVDEITYDWNAYNVWNNYGIDLV